MRAYATQVEVLRRLRNGGQQFVRVEHVHVNDGAQAVIGNVEKPDTRVYWVISVGSSSGTDTAGTHA